MNQTDNLAAVIKQLHVGAAEHLGEIAEAMAGLKPIGCWVDEPAWPWNYGIADLARTQWAQPLLPRRRCSRDHRTR